MQRLRGFDGTRDTVSIIYERYDGNTATAVGGTALVGDWLQARNGDWHQGWEVGGQEQALLNKIADDQKFASEVLKVNSTPNFFINGEMVKGATSFEEFDKKIKALLKS